jgi:hypothetical protein
MKVEENRSRFRVFILVGIGRDNVRMVDVESYRRVAMSLVDVGVFGVGTGYFHVGQRNFSSFLQNQSRGDECVADTAAGS